MHADRVMCSPRAAELVLAVIFAVYPVASFAAPFAYMTSTNIVKVVDTATNTMTANLSLANIDGYAVGIAPSGNKVYVSGSNNAVAVLDTSTNTVSTTIPVGTTPKGIVVTADGSKVYVSNNASASVSVINTATDTVSATIPLPGATPYGIDVTPDGARAYVANFPSSGVRVIDTATNSLLTTIPTPAGTQTIGVAVIPGGAKVYVTHYGGGNKVSVISSATNSVIGAIDVGANPWGIAASPDGTRVYVANQAGDTVSVINTVTDTVVTTITGFTSPVGMSFTPDGARIFVAQNTTNNIKVISVATNTITATVTVDGGTISTGKFIVPPDIVCGNGFPQPGEQCDDGNAIDGDGCDNNCTMTACGNGIVTSGEQCDDANLATGDCCSATCQYEASGDPCAGDGNECTDDECDGSGTCSHPNTSAGGACASDGNICTDDECDGSGLCAHLANSQPCDDGLFCNGGDTCVGGTCSSHDGDPCVGGSECADACNEVDDTCNEIGGTPCGADGNACTDDECDGEGACAHSPNAAVCNDGVFCNGVDTCSGGSCSIHAGDPCTAGSECTNSCNETGDNCFDASGTPCTGDMSICTTDECDGAGACTHQPGNAGTECRSDVGQCDVPESCDGASPTCPPDSFEPDGTTCNDSMECTITDECTAGSCSGSSVTCGDGAVQSACNEECDDGAFALDDGCDDACQFEPCKPTPEATCKLPFISAKASIKLKNDATDNTKHSVQWKWSKGSQTDKIEFGDPINTDDYWLCIYDDGALVSTTRVPAGGSCDGKPCWSEKPKGFQFKSKTPSVDGATGVKLGAGDDGKAKAQFKGKGSNLDLPDLGTITGPIMVQLVKKSGGTCWAASYSAPFTKDDGVNLSDRAD